MGITRIIHGIPSEYKDGGLIPLMAKQLAPMRRSVSYLCEKKFVSKSEFGAYSLTEQGADRLKK